MKMLIAAETIKNKRNTGDTYDLSL